jgi:hypothetical protein
VLGGVLLVSVALAYPLFQGLFLAQEVGREDLIVRAFLGLGLLAALIVFSVILIRRQHKSLDEARDELAALVTGEESPSDSS